VLQTQEYLTQLSRLKVAIKCDSYVLHRILPTKVDPLVSLMKVEKVPDSTYDMIGGLE
jgi:26S proteasome regulatory subunit T6